jgi:hypothetical protein
LSQQIQLFSLTPISAKTSSMTHRLKGYLQARPRSAFAASVVGTALLVHALLLVVSSLFGQNYLIEPAFLEPFRAPTRDEAFLIYPAEYAFNSNESNDVIFLGDSTCRCSIDPIEFHRLSGLSAYNLGNYGALGLEGHRLILEAYCRHHPRPRVVVLALTPDTFDVEPWNGIGSWPSRFRSSYGPDRTARLLVPDSLESLQYYARRGVDLARSLWADSTADHRFDPLTQPLNGDERYTYVTLERKMRRTRGYWSLGGQHWPGGTEPPTKAKMVITPSWDRGLRELADVAEANGVPLVFRMVPVVDAMTTDFDPVREWLKTVERDHKHLTVIRPEVLHYDSELCWDYQHLNSGGVAKFTQSLAKDVAAVLSRSGNAAH